MILEKKVKKWKKQKKTKGYSPVNVCEIVGKTKETKEKLWKKQKKQKNLCIDQKTGRYNAPMLVLVMFLLLELSGEQSIVKMGSWRGLTRSSLFSTRESF